MSMPQPPHYAPYPYPYPPLPPVSPFSPVKAARRTMRRAVNRPAGMVLACWAIAQGLAFILMGVVGAMEAIRRMESGAGAASMSEAVRSGVQYAGVISLIGFGTAMVFLLIANRRMVFRRGFWTGERGEVRRMRAGWALDFLGLTLCAQAVFSLTQALFAALGVTTVSPALQSLDDSAVTWQMWLYIGLVGPVFEELLFRGVLMQSLAPYGRNFAIVTSATMFAFYHGDLAQGTFAFFMGLLLGFVAMEYSLTWSIALHVFNNAVLGGALPQLAARYGDAGGVVYGLALLGVGIVGGIVVFVRHGREMRAYARFNRSPHGTYWGWTSPWFIVFIALESLVIAMSLIGLALAA
ncbi:CPBP family intramembrane glutamic endopeptidase [Bifidobacterium avesanii]|uniref:CPBP family intramembrane metalloprotease n=1 Tax=Bifidobacterium avesanii TaxID=1798157 RepID=A0A7K3TK96_9BIFI|nr:type II CAAX endopeptidase family protein [Bifidobacterium avesanii]KAB8291907.1 metal-dependent membrane protease [Bifidobacterium avesanii]NEG78673.1 CPBP family intramembrane metalloprotease [Bifidobacterium avesanii]